MIPLARSLAVRVLAVVNVVVLVCGVSLAGAERIEGPRPRPQAARLALEGLGRISGLDGRRMVSGGDHVLRAGDVIDVVDGEAVVRMVEGGSVELWSGGDASGSRLALTEVPTLLAGDALVVAPANRSLAIDAGGARLRLVDGAGRVSRSTGASFVVYEGAATLSSGGRELRGGLPALRQVVVPAPGKLPLRASPLNFGSVPHPWDRRFLGDVIDLQAALKGRSIGFTASLRDDVSPEVSFFQTILPGLVHEPAFDQALLDEQQRPVGETLVGAAVALVGEGDGFGHRWREVFRLREAGAGWGVVAVDLSARRAELMSALDEAVNRSPLIFSGPPANPTFPTFPPLLTPSQPRRTQPAPPPVPAPRLVRPAPLAPPSPPPPPPVVVPAPPAEPESVLEPVADPLVNLLDGVLEGLDDLTGGLI